MDWNINDSIEILKKHELKNNTKQELPSTILRSKLSSKLDNKIVATSKDLNIQSHTGELPFPIESERTQSLESILADPVSCYLLDCWLLVRTISNDERKLEEQLYKACCNYFNNAKQEQKKQKKDEKYKNSIKNSRQEILQEEKLKTYILNKYKCYALPFKPLETVSQHLNTLKSTTANLLTETSIDMVINPINTCKQTIPNKTTVIGQLTSAKINLQEAKQFNNEAKNAAKTARSWYIACAFILPILIGAPLIALWHSYKAEKNNKAADQKRLMAKNTLNSTASINSGLLEYETWEQQNKSRLEKDFSEIHVTTDTNSKAVSDKYHTALKTNFVQLGDQSEKQRELAKVALLKNIKILEESTTTNVTATILNDLQKTDIEPRSNNVIKINNSSPQTKSNIPPSSDNIIKNNNATQANQTLAHSPLFKREPVVLKNVPKQIMTEPKTTTFGFNI